MLDILFFCVVLALILFPISVLMQGHTDAIRDRFRGYLETVQKATGGRLHTDNSKIGDAILSIPTGSGDLEVFFHTVSSDSDDDHYTTVQLCYTGPRVPRMEIYPEKPIHAVAKLLGMQDIQIGVSAFDESFILKSDDEEFLKRVLTPEVQAQLLGPLQSLPGELYFTSRPGMITLRKQAWQPTAAALEELIGQARSFFHQIELLLGTASHATIGEAAKLMATPLKLEGSHCLVCGQALVPAPAVGCNRCHTPHHATCWEYNQRCAVYGCAGVAATPLSVQANG